MDSINSFMKQISDIIKGLNPEYVMITAICIGFILLILVFLLTKSLMESDDVRKRYQSFVDKNKNAIINSMKVTKNKLFNYDEMLMFIKRSGLSAMSGDKITPLGYIFIKFASAIFCLIFGLQIGIVYGIALLPLGYFLPELIVNESNKSDNKQMLDDIKNIYDTLRIQTKAGVYITSVITDCYLVVKNKRLKKALLKLTSDIAAKNDIEESLDEFRNRFSNEYIDTLVIIIKQSMQTGQAAKMFDDIRGQIADIESAIIQQEQVRIRKNITICQVMLYCSIIITALYVAFSSLQSNLDF